VQIIATNRAVDLIEEKVDVAMNRPGIGGDHFS
jgi:hypothetical protein